MLLLCQMAGYHATYLMYIYVTCSATVHMYIIHSLYRSLASELHHWHLHFSGCNCNFSGFNCKFNFNISFNRIQLNSHLLMRTQFQTTLWFFWKCIDMCVQLDHLIYLSRALALELWSSSLQNQIIVKQSELKCTKCTPGKTASAKKSALIVI